MSRRVLLTSALIALLLGIVVLAPGFPPVRSALLQLVIDAAERAGVDLTYDQADGNAWRRVELQGVTVTAPGADVELERLEVAYHLPSLLGGELPFSLAVSGVRGDLDFGGIEQLVNQTVTGGTGGGLPVRPVLRAIDVQDVQLTSENAPFTIPDASVSHVTVAPEPGALRLGATVTTRHGSVTAQGRLSVPGFEFAGTVSQGDVSVAQHWWPGAVSGSFSGPFSWRRGQLNADVTITDASVQQSGFTATDVSGTARMRYPMITASLGGTSLNGPLSAEGTINVSGLNYHITGSATPQLGAATDWLAAFLNMDALPADATGQVQLDATVTGWKTPTVEATARGEGTLAGLPLQNLNATLVIQTGSSIRGGLNAQLGGGEIVATIAPSAVGTRLELLGTNLLLENLNVNGITPGGTLQRLGAQVELAGLPTGTVTAAWAGDLAGYATGVDVDGRLDADGLQAFFAASAAPPADQGTTQPISATGAVVFADNRLEAGVSVADLEVPALSRPLRLELTAQGQLTDLQLTATIQNQQPVLLDLAWLQPDGVLANSDPLDVRGTATGRLTGTEVTGVAGAFGPVSLTGSVQLAPLAADLAFDVAPLTVRVGATTAASPEPEIEPVETTPAAAPSYAIGAVLSVEGGSLRYADQVLLIEGQAAVDGARAGTARFAIAALDARFELRTAAAQPARGPATDLGDDAPGAAAAVWDLTATTPDRTARFHLDSGGGQYALTLDDLPVRLTQGGRPALVTGSLTPNPDGTLSVLADLAPQSSLAGLTLQNGATLQGAILPAQRSLELAGALGALPVHGVVSWQQPLVAVTATVTTGTDADLHVLYVPSSQAWSLTGDAPLAPLLAELGLTGVTAAYEGGLSYDPEQGYQGQGLVRVLQPVPVDLQLAGTGQQLDLLLEGKMGGVPLQGGGSVTQPLVSAVVQALGPEPAGAPALLVDVGPLQDLTLDVQGLRGAGEVPEMALGPVTVGPVPWSLEFEWATTAGFVEASDQTLNVALQDGEVRVAGSLAAPIAYGGDLYQLAVWPGAFAGATVTENQLEDFPVGGTLTPVTGGAPLATVAGTLDALDVQLDAELQSLAEALPPQYRPNGRLTASATVDALAGPTYSGQLTLSSADSSEVQDNDPPPTASGEIQGSDPPPGAADDLHATFSGVGAGFELDVLGAGLQVDHLPGRGTVDGRLTLVADQVDVSRFLPPGAAGQLDGTLSYGAAGWRGSLATHLGLAAQEGAPGAEPLLDVTATLDGAFSTLRLDLQGTAVGNARMTASGTLLPQPDVQGDFQVQGGALSGSFLWRDAITATVHSAQLDLGGVLSVPPVTAELNVNLASGAVSLANATPNQGGTQANRALVDLQLLGGDLSGAVALPAELNGVPALLSADVGGSLANPSVAAELRLSAADEAPSVAGAPAATLAGSLSAGAELQGALPRQLLARLLPSQAGPALELLGPQVTLEGNVQPSGTWTAQVAAPVADDIMAADSHMNLRLVASGTVAAPVTYAGELHLLGVHDPQRAVTTDDLTPAVGHLDPVAVATFAGYGADADARLDLATVDWQLLSAVLGVPVQVDGGGLLTVGTQPLNAELTVDLTGKVGENAVSLQGSAPDDLRVTYAGPAGQLQGTLAWDRSLTGGGSALLTGDLANRPVELLLEVDDGLTSGSLDLRAVGASLTARLTTEEGANGVLLRTVNASANAPPGTLAAFGGAAEATISVDGPTVHMDSLVASVDGLLGSPAEPLDRLTVVAAGPLASDLNITGLVTSPRLQEGLQLSVTNEAVRAAQASGVWSVPGPTLTGVVARLDWRDLSVSASMQHSGLLALTGVADSDDLETLLQATGEALPPALQDDLTRLRPRITGTNLAWSADAGWLGSLTAEADVPWLPALGRAHVSATAEGGALRVVADTDVQDGTTHLSVLVPAQPWTAAGLSGDLELDLPSSALLPGLDVPLQLRSSAVIDGTPFSPTLDGSVLLSGAVQAQGTYTFAGGVGQLNVAGPELTISGTLDADGAFAEASLTSLSVGAWLPQLPSGQLSLDARVAGSQLSIERLTLTAHNSQVTGGATIGFGGGNGAQQARFSAALDAAVDLTDLVLGAVDLTGVVRGPLVLSSATLDDIRSANVIANLAALNVSTPALDWSVSGNLTLGGTLGDPTVASQLSGDGELRGLLNVTARPAQREYAVTSTLSIGQLATDLRVDVGNGATSAAGSLRFGDGVLLVSSRPAQALTGEDQGLPASAQPQPDDIVVTGAGSLAGVSAALRGDLSALAVNGDLGRLGGGLTGQLHAVADGRADTWLSGEVVDLSVAGYRLQPLSIAAVTLGAPILIQSSDLRATLDPTNLEWTVGVSDYQLGAGPAAPALNVWGRGRGAAGSLDASLSTADLTAALELRHDQDTSLLLEGRAYGGQFQLTGTRSAATGEWAGSGRYQGGTWQGFQLQAQATLLGAGMVPSVVLSTRAQNGLFVAGNASLGSDGVTIDQFVSGGPLEQTLRLQGRVLPRNDLTLSTLAVEPRTTPGAAEAAQATTSSVQLVSFPALGPNLPASLRATGSLSVPVGPALIQISGSNTPPQLGVALAGLPRWGAEGSVEAGDLIELVQGVAANGLELHGRDDLSGSLRLDTSNMRLELDGFGLRLAGLEAEATGSLGLDGADLHGQVLLRTDLPVAERATGYLFPWNLTADNGVWQLASNGDHGQLHVRYGPEQGAGGLSVSADLQLSDGTIQGQLGLHDGGLAGTLSVADVRLLSPELGPLSIDLEATVAEGRVGGSSTLDSAAGRLVLNGVWGLAGLLPDTVAPGAPAGGRLEARIRALELSDVPYLAQQVPELRGEVTGTAQLRDGFLFGQLVAQEIAVADLTTPMQLNFSGRPEDVSLDLQLRGALGRANLTGGTLSGMFRFERFPLNLLSTAVVGPSDFLADLTGVMRFDGPVTAPQDGYLRLATEEVRLERMGVTTLGNVTVTFDQNALLVERAEFAGLGTWRASGVLRPDEYDFRLEADRADFTPLLGLIPQFARLGVGAVGSFDLSVLGSAANPNIVLTSPDLTVDVANTSYRLEDTSVELTGVNLSVASRVHGVQPISGTLNVDGQALLSLYPFNLSATQLQFTGAADLSTFGRLTGIEGALRQQADGTPVVNLRGTMGAQPLTIEGSLAPLDLRATGRGVTARLPNLLVDRAVVDADIRLVSEPGGVALSGSVVADEVIVDPAARRPTPPTEPVEEAADQADPVVTSIPEIETPPPPQEPTPTRSGDGLAALRFDDLSVRAPGRVTLTTNVGSFEAGLDLVLSGTGAQPRLAGSATAIRGNLRFGGRDFNIDRATATFTPNRGVYPELDVAAHSEFDKQRVVAAAPNVSFAAPREGSTFEVQLAFFGPVEATDDGGFRFDIHPILGSNALIEVDGQGGGGNATRPFTEAELMSLVTLGRFELNADLIGAGGLGEAVATGALDTAIDLLVVSGLEAALREALGLDVVEIRTSSLSTLLDAGGQPFGVSLRVGGYLNPELFASYRIGTYDGGDPEFSITNEVMLSYALGPLDLDLIGRIDLPAAGTIGQPRPEIGTVLGYQVSPWLAVDGGVTLSTTRSRVEFGVTIRW